LSVNNISVDYGGFTIGGNAITLTGNYSSNATASADGTISIALRLSPGAHTFTVATTPGLNFDDIFSAGISDAGGGPASLIKAGNGGLRLLGSGNSYTGLTTLSDGYLLPQAAGVCVPGDLVIDNALVLYSNLGPGNQIADTAAVTINQDGELDLLGQS